MSLYHSALNALRQQARREFQQSTIGRVFGEIDRMQRRGTAGRKELVKMSRDLKKLRNPSIIRSELRQTGVGKLIGEVDRYARRGMKQAILDEVLGSLGPVGDLIGTFLRPQGKKVASVDRELQAAANLLRTFGYRVNEPESRRQSEKTATSEIERSKQFLESMGFKVEPPAPERSRPPIPQPSDTPGRVIVSAGGIKFDVKPDDPLLTGEMISVTSSNVHSIGFIWNDADPTRGTIRVRYLNKRKSARSTRGSIYHYSDVHPALFMDFRKAASKGGWVWDHLRIRGTVSGHRFRYTLASLSSDGYVPRKAVRIGNEEWYLRRSVKGQNGQQYRSELQNQFVQFYDDKQGRPNRGGPNRGRPNRGGPNRGR